MNFSKKPKPVDWKKILIVAIVLAIGGYQWYVQNVVVKPAADAVAKEQSEEPSDEPSDEPAAREPDLLAGTTAEKKPVATRSATNAPTKSKTTGASVDKLPTSARTPANRSNEPATKKVASKQPVVTDKKDFLESVGGKNLRSPAGLVYGMGGGGEHRVEHVMKHGADDLNRPSHGVFDGDQEAILKLLDEAYEMVKSKSKYVKSESSQGNTAYTVSMGRKIGYEGGEKGNRSGNRGLNSVRLVLDGDRVITAYPYR